MNFISMILTLFFATILVCMLVDFEIRHKKDLYLMTAFVVMITILDTFIWLNCGYNDFMKLYPLLAQIPLYIAFLFVSKYKGIKLLFIHLTVIALVTSIVLFGIMIASLLGLNRTSMDIFCIIMYFPVGFVVFRYFRPYILYLLRNTDKGWLAFCIIPLSFTLITYSAGKYNLELIRAQNSLSINIRALVFTTVSYIIMLRYFKKTREHFALQNEQYLLQMQITASKYHLEALKESQEMTILYRHDMRHHLNLINAYLLDDNKAAAQAYIAEVANTIESTVVETYCSNYSLNLLLCSYITKAKIEQITVETQIDLPEVLSVSDMDLCIVFANAIENAINALVQVQNVAERQLKIICKSKNNKLLIQIINHYVGTVTFSTEMPVNTTENHGYGTKSIAAIAERYHGIYSFTAENGIFKTSLIL